MDIRYYIDPASGLPHVYDHGVNEDEVEQAFANRGEDRPGSKDSWLFRNVWSQRLRNTLSALIDAAYLDIKARLKNE